MDIIELISKVYEFSEKGEEFSDEIKAFRATLMSLQLTMKEVGANHLPSHIVPILNKDLQEAEELISKTSNVNASWFTNFRNMLPGAPLQKIKEKNEQLTHRINLLNLHLNTMRNKRGLDRVQTTSYDDEDEPAKLKKLHTFTDQSGPKEILNLQKKSASAGGSNFDTIMAPTLLDEEDENKLLEGPTQADGPEEEYCADDVAFRLRVIYDERLGKELRNCKDFIPMIEKRWEGNNKVEYVFKRVDFSYLPNGDIQKVSREHTTLTAIKRVPSKGPAKQEDLTFAATVPDDDKFIGATVPDDGDDYGKNDNAMEEEKNEFILKDLSLNGTYYIKGADLLNFPLSGMKIKADFKHLAKNEETPIQNGDIIALVVQKPQCKDLVFGFQLLTE